MPKGPRGGPRPFAENDDIILVGIHLGTVSKEWFVDLTNAVIEQSPSTTDFTLEDTDVFKRDIDDKRTVLTFSIGKQFNGKVLADIINEMHGTNFTTIDIRVGKPAEELEKFIDR